METSKEASTKHKLLLEVINSRNAVSKLYRNYHINQQERARRLELYFQPLVKEIKDTKLST